MEGKSPPLWRNFLLGGVATSGACLFTNPLEVVKTRLQLQGELEKSATKHYRGLVPAVLYQFTMNGVRLGSYHVLKDLLGTSSSSNDPPRFAFARNLAAGATAGVCGAVVGSPFFLVKIRTQSQSNFAQVGHQYHYKSMRDAFKTIYRESGFKGLMKGWNAAAIRVGSGSSVQLSSYDLSKGIILKTGLGTDTDTLVHFSASLLTGVMVVIAMNPFDVVSTRLYNEKTNQGKGAFYTGPLDCFVKTVKAEGVQGLYKGALAHYLRVGPHTILTFIFFEQLKILANKYW